MCCFQSKFGHRGNLNAQERRVERSVEQRVGSEGQSFNCTSLCCEALWNCEESSGGDLKKPGKDADRADESRCISKNE